MLSAISDLPVGKAALAVSGPELLFEDSWDHKQENKRKAGIKNNLPLKKIYLLSSLTLISLTVLMWNSQIG